MKENGFAMWGCDPNVYTTALVRNTLGKENIFIRTVSLEGLVEIIGVTWLKMRKQQKKN